MLLTRQRFGLDVTKRCVLPGLEEDEAMLGSLLVFFKVLRWIDAFAFA